MLLYLCLLIYQKKSQTQKLQLVMHNYYSSMTISNKDEKYTTQTKEKKMKLKVHMSSDFRDSYG